MLNKKEYSLEHKIDAYVRGKMSPDEEVNFEAEFLDSPDVIEAIEQLTALKKGMAHYEFKSKDQDSLSNRLRHNFWSNAGLGAIAASLICLPLGMVIEKTTSDSGITVAYVNFPVQETARGIAEFARPTTAPLPLTGAESDVFMGFDVPPLKDSDDNLLLWNIEIFNAEKKLIWQAKQLNPGDRSTIYIKASKQSLNQKNAHFYRLYAPKDESNSTIDGVLQLN